MRINPKVYKKHVLKKLIKSTDLIIICNVKLKNNALKSKDFEQLIKNNNINFYSFKSSILRVLLKNSIFFNQLSFLNGSLTFIIFNSNTNFLNIVKKFNILNIKITNKLYNFYQFSTVNNLDYKKNLISFHESLTSFTKNFSLVIHSHINFSE